METLKDTIDPSLLADDGCNIHAQNDLIGVLTHIGRSADSGHYMAWTKDEESDDWWKFDDDQVTQVKADDVLKLCGGGDWHMAYLLLYRAKDLA